MSQAGRYTPEVTPGTYIEQIDGDVGSVSGAIISFNSTPISGSSTSFNGIGTTMFFEVTDANINTIIGNNAGNNSITGIQNTSLGSTTLTSLTSGSNNFAAGVGAGSLLTTGSYNLLIGYDAGANYTSSESSNILLGYNLLGTASESNTLRIGVGTGTSNGQLNRAFISGIEGITVSSADQVLVINSSNQIGSIAHGTSGQAFISGGAGANPTWGTLTVSYGGTGDNAFTAYSVICGGTTSTGALQNVSGVGTAGQVLTSQGAASLPHWAANAAILTIDGDVGSVTGNTISFNSTPISGSSTAFNGFGTTMLFEVTDANINTIIGNNAGNSSISGAHNTSLGASSLLALTSGIKNCALGVGALESVTSGGSNIGIGYDVGSTLTTGSNNIYIGQITGASSSEADTTRIGNTGTTAACYILGIGGVDVASTANVVVESSDQLGTAVLAAGTNISISAGPNIITIASSSAVVSEYVTVVHSQSPYTALSTDYFISCDVTAGVISILLPNAPTTGRVFIIKDKFGLCATNNITVTTVGGTVGIDSATSYVMNAAYQSVSVIFDGTNYEVF